MKIKKLESLPVQSEIFYVISDVTYVKYFHCFNSQNEAIWTNDLFKCMKFDSYEDALICYSNNDTLRGRKIVMVNMTCTLLGGINDTEISF